MNCHRNLLKVKKKSRVSLNNDYKTKLICLPVYLKTLSIDQLYSKIYSFIHNDVPWYKYKYVCSVDYLFYILYNIDLPLLFEMVVYRFIDSNKSLKGIFFVNVNEVFSNYTNL